MKEKSTKIVDMHTHVAPRMAVKIANEGGTWHGIKFSRDKDGKLSTSSGSETMVLPWPKKMETPEMRLESMDKRKVDMHVLSLSPLMHWHGLDKSDCVPFAKDTNDDIADYIQTDTSRYKGFGFLPLQDTDSAVRELERCVKDLGFLGAMVSTHVNGLDWDSDKLFPVLEMADSLGALIFFHPTRGGRANSWLNKYHLRNLIGNPLETTNAIASIIFGGVMDKLPNIKLCFAHAGGYACHGIGRFDHGYNVRPEASEGIKNLPSDYVKKMYFDSITHSDRSLRYLIDTVGSSQVLLGSDYPADMGEPYPVDFVKNCKTITDDEKKLILSENIKAFI